MPSVISFGQLNRLVTVTLMNTVPFISKAKFCLQFSVQPKTEWNQIQWLTLHTYVYPSYAIAPAAAAARFLFIVAALLVRYPHHLPILAAPNKKKKKK